MKRKILKLGYKNTTKRKIGLPEKKKAALYTYWFCLFKKKSGVIRIKNNGNPL